MRRKPQYKIQGQSLDTTRGQNLDKTRTTPQIEVNEQKKAQTGKHWQTECRRQRVMENNKTQRDTMQQDKNTTCRQN